MKAVTDWLGTPEALSWMTALATLVTGIATIALWRATKQLVNATNEMASRSSQPNIVAILEPNQWSMNHFDLKITNTGNATAYEISISFDPPLQNGETRAGKDVPLQNISVLRPGQTMSSYLTGYSTLKGQTFQVKTSWKRAPKSVQSEDLNYTFDMSMFDHVSGLGTGDPQVQIAEQIKHIREDWRPVSIGHKKIQSDVFTSKDRELEQKKREAYMKKMRTKNIETTKT